MSYLTCPTCQFTVSAAAASTPFRNCPRCLLRTSTQVLMVSTTKPTRRFTRPSGADVDRIAEAKARLTRPARGVGSA